MKTTLHIFLAVLVSGWSTVSMAQMDLGQCVELAWERNIEVQSRQIDAQQVEIAWQQRKASLFPTLNAGATHGYNWGQTIDPFTNQFASDRVRNNNFFLSSELLLFNGFALQNDIKRAELDYLAIQEDLQSTMNDIGLFVAQSYLSILFNEEQVNAAKAQLDISERQVERMQRMVDVGQEAIISLYEVQATLATDQVALTNAENTLAITRLQLANILLLNVQETAEFEIVRPEIEPSDITEPLADVTTIFSAAMTHLPQLTAIALREESADKAWEAARGGRSPSISLTGSVGSGYSGANQIPTGDPTIDVQEIGFVEGSLDPVLAPDISFDGFEARPFDDQLEDNFNQSLSLRLTIPVFNGLQVSSDIQRSRLEMERARLNTQAVRNQVLQDVQQAHADALAAQRNYEAAERANSAAELNFQNAEARFEQDMMSPVDFNVAKSNLARVQADFIRSKYDFIFRRAVVDFYLGRGIQLSPR